MQFVPVSARSMTVLGSVAILMISGTTASAAITASDPFITIHATSGSSSGTFTVALSSPEVLSVSDPDVDLWGYTASTATPILDGSNNVVATLVSFGVIVGRQTQPDGEVRWGVDFDFSINAGSADTTIEILSPTLFFDAVVNAVGISSAGYNATDQNLNGIAFAPGLESGFTYQSIFNGGSVFQQYMNSGQSAVSGTIIDAGNPDPLGIFQPIPGGVVSSMQARMKFTISANDAIAGSSQFSVAPSPGAAALLGLGGLVIGRRRR